MSNVCLSSNFKLELIQKIQNTLKMFYILILNSKIYISTAKVLMQNFECKSSNTKSLNAKKY